MSERPAITTFLFTDIEGSARLWEREPERMRAALVRHDALARAAIESHRGLVVKTLGDGVYAAFDDPLDAINSMLQLQHSLAEPDATAGLALEVRCGVHLGSNERRDGDFFGATVNRAARIMSVAHGGQMLLSQPVAALVADRLPPGVFLRDLGTVRLRNLAHPERVFQVVHPQLRHDFPALGSLEATPNNLPQHLTSFLGRERELAQLTALAAGNRLVTVTGPGGVGKTRLVVEAASQCYERFPDGVWLVELGALGDPALVTTAVNTTLGIALAPHLDPLSALTLQLGDKRLLLVLDNCEHVIGAVASLLEAVLSAAPNLCALTSSQELIGIAGEQVFRLPSLAVPTESALTADAALATGAVQLFVARAKAADPGFVFDDRVAGIVAAICRRLDGIPLALEMAAGRVPLLGVEALARRLDDRFRVLTGGKRTALPRQRTLHATLDWSFGLLTPPEQATFRRLGVFAGQFVLDAAVAVATGGDGDEFDVIEALTGLCAKSLVVVETRGGDARYRLLETARAYALERLAEANETAATARRHAMHYRRYFAACFDDWTTLSDADFVARYAPEIDNLRLAVTWSLGPDGDDETAIALVGSSGQVWVALSLYEEAEGLVDRALARVTTATPAELEAELWSAVAAIYRSRDTQRTIHAARRAADLHRRCGDSVRLGCALHALGTAHAAEADSEAESVLLEARPLLHRTGRHRLQAMSRSAFGLLHGARGNAVKAIEEVQAALEGWRAAGAHNAALRALGTLADLAWMQGDLDGAIDRTRDVLEQYQRAPLVERLARTYSTANLFGMLVERGDLAEARAIGQELLPELRALRITHGWSDHFASYLARTGNGEAAVRLVGWADALRAARGLRRQPNETRARETSLARVREVIDEKEVERLLADGAALSDDEVHRLALP